MLNERSLAPWSVSEEPGIGVGGELVSLVVDRQGSPVANCGSGPLGERNALLVSMAPLLYSVVLRALAELPDTEADWVSSWVTDARLCRDVLGGSREGE